MKKIYLSIIAITVAIITSWGQNPGLVISEFYQNPSGSDSPFEYVELLATDDIDFTSTPYTIIFSNNGVGTAAGWIEGGSVTYAFEVSTGSVSVGDVVYVGGSEMAPTGTVLRSIDTGVDGGDGGIGNSSSGGVLGNGGGNGDGIAVFNVGVAFITSSSVPTDAVIYGTGIGGAEVGPTDGYEMPINDFYDGGKLEGSDFYALDADLTVATGGVFDLVLGEFIEARTFESGAGTDGLTEIEFAEIVSPKFSFIIEDTTALESAGIVTLSVELIDANGTPSSGDIIIRNGSTANSPDDFILLDTTITFVGDVDGVTTFNIEVLEDLLAEQSEYIMITIDSLENVELDDNTQMFLYITDNDRVIPTGTNELKLDLLTSFSTGIEEESSAEIVVFDTVTTNLFVVNSIANQIDIIDFSIPDAPVLLDSIEFDSVGFINSVAIYEGVIAVAIAAPIAQDSGFVSFWNTDGSYLNRLTVGALPDMVTFNQDGTQLIAACEGEPNDDYTVDPNGGVSIIEITGPIEDLTAGDVTNLDFTAFDSDEDDLRESGVRIFGLDASVAQDLEPEFVTVLDDNITAYVVLQENNALAIVDLLAKEILEIRPLGTIDHSLYGYGLDVSNRTSGINIANFPIHGMFMPDAIDNISILGTTYLVTANEGDSRDYDGYSEEERVDDLDLDSLIFLERDFLHNDRLLGRLKTTSANGDIDGDGDYDKIYSYGTRSFSIWDEVTGDLVFDSGDLIEQIIANDPIYVDLFNAHNEGGELEQKNRSDDKGPEPEGVVAAIIDGNAFLFVSLERVGGVMAFNINDVSSPQYIGYHNNRDAVTNGPDRGAEGMIFIDPSMSPNGNGLLVLANEVSSSLTVYEVNSCQTLSELVITTEDDATAFCEGDSLSITAESIEELELNWELDGMLLEETDETIFAEAPGFYQVSFINESETCQGKTDSLVLAVNELPLVEAFVSEDSICYGQEATFSSSGAETYVWETDGVENDIPYGPEDAGLFTYTVIGTDANNCKNVDSVELTMAEEILIDFITTDEIFGTDGEIDLTVTGGFGAYSFDWNNDEVDDFDDDEDLVDLTAGTYVVVVQDEFGCATTETISLNSQVGIEMAAFIELSVYPNPTTDQLFMEANGAFEFSLRDMNGALLMNGLVNNQEMISMGDLASGIYILQITHEDKTTQILKVNKR